MCFCFFVFSYNDFEMISIDLVRIFFSFLLCSFLGGLFFAAFCWWVHSSLLILGRAKKSSLKMQKILISRSIVVSTAITISVPDKVYCSIFLLKVFTVKLNQDGLGGMYVRESYYYYFGGTQILHKISLFFEQWV